jgi:hypothetical protein
MSIKIIHVKQNKNKNIKTMKINTLIIFIILVKQRINDQYQLTSKNTTQTTSNRVNKIVLDI